MNTDFSIPFEANLRSLFSGNDFTSLDTTQYGEYVKGYTDEFLKIKGLDSNDDRNYYESLAETTLANYRKQNNYPRFVPTREQSSELFERFPDLSLVDNIDEREKKVDEWRNKSFEKASAIRPAEREDIGVYLDALSNNFIRESASELNQTNWVGDKVYRFAEAFARPVHELIDKPGAERAWAKTAPEDPNRDEDFTSMLASGFGQAGMQILTAATLTAAGQPELVPYVFGAMFGAQYMKDGYYNEMRRSGDEDKAWNNAVSQIPAAFLETIGDVALVRGVTKTARGYGKAFASATTEAEKRAILREALPSVGKSAMEGFVAEAFIGGMGAEFASGFGSYLATGNEDYLRSFGEIVKSGLAEGIVGAVTSGAVHGFTAGNAQTRIAEDISVLTGFNDIKAKQEGINEALKRRDFDKVISLTNGQFVDPSQFDAHLEASDTLRGRATDENGEPIAKPKDKNDYSGRVPVSSPITSTAKNSLIAEATLNDSEISKLSALPSRTEEEEQKLSALTERNTYVKGVIESINNKTYENPTEVDLTFDDSNEAFYEGKESKEKPKREGVHEVVLENGETLNDDGAVVYFDKKFQQDFNTAVAHYGKENVSIKRNVNGNTANIYINKDGKWVKTNAESSYNVNPSKGAVPVSFVENEDSKSVKVKFHPTVKDSTKLPANFTIVEDTGDSVKVRHSDGRVFTFTGDRAIAAREMNAKREEVKQAKEDKKKKPDKTEKSKDSGKQLPSLLDDSEINQENPVSEEKFTQKKVNQNDPMSVLVDEELRSLSNSERKKLSPGRFERQSLSDVSDKGVDLWHEGKRGRVKKDATTGRFYFEAEDKTQIELNGNQESSLASVGITKGGKPGSPKEKVSLTTNKPSSEKKQSHKTLISSLKEKLDQIHHDSIDRLSSISGIINKLISLGVEYKVMSQEEIAKEYGENNSPGFATSDGKIVFNLDALNATNKHDLLFKILAIHESAHAGIYIVAQQNPELYQAAKESVNNNPELIALAREEYGKGDNGNYRFDSMNQDGIFHETIRMIIEGRLTGRTTGLANSGPLKAFLQKLIDYIRNIMWRTSDRIVFQFVKNVEDVLGVTNSAIKIENENITVNDIPSNIVSDFVRIINGEDVDLENYKRDQLRDLADLMRIKRDRPDIKERLLSRIKEYKPISDSSNTNIINNSQPIIVGSDFFADSGKFYRVIQGDESLNDILQSGEVRTNAAEKIKSGMTLAEKMAARPTAFPSFSKGSASMSYAAENPNHSIIVTADKSLQPSTSGRHSAGKTHFPTVDGVHQKSLGNNFQVYKHIGNGEYELVFDKGMTGEIDNAPFSLAPRSQQDTEYLAAVEAGDMEKAQRMVDEAALPKLENLAKKALSEIYKGKKTRVEVRDGNLVVLTSRQYTIGKGVLTQNLKGNTVSKDTLEASVPLALASFRSFSFLNPVTYDESGNVIPLSQRFDSTNNNIQNSQPITNEIVARHTELEEKFNNKTITPEETAEAQRIVNAAAKRPGFITKASHATSSDFNEFIKSFDKSGGFWFSSKDLRSAIGANKILNVFIKGEPKIWKSGEMELKKAFRLYPDMWNDAPSGVYEVDDKEYGGKSYLVKNPNQIKSADPFTGVSLDKRFDSTNNNIQNSQPINLGDKFSFRLANSLRNSSDAFLGLKIANDGTLPTQSLIAKVRKSGITEFEVDSITNLINSLEDNGRVNIDELSEAVDNEPTLVINTLNAFEDKSANIEAAQEYASLYHEAETKGYSAQEIYARTDGFDSLEESEKINISKEDQELFEKLRIAKKNQSVKNNEDIPATGRFGVDPYSNEVLSGAEIEPGHRLIWSGDLSLNIPSGENKIIRQRKVDNYEQINAFANEVKFTSQHYQGEVADNQLAFVRGGIHEYQKGNVLPDGTIAKDTTRIFEIWEVQSDWDSSVKPDYKFVESIVENQIYPKLKDFDNPPNGIKTEEENGNYIIYSKNGRVGASQKTKKLAIEVYNKIRNEFIEYYKKREDEKSKEKSSPLLKYWESLALKAAINHAKREGASNIIISDAETAMMTEGHDNREDFKYTLKSIKGKSVNLYNSSEATVYTLNGEVRFDGNDIFVHTTGNQDESIKLTFRKKAIDSKIIPEAQELVKTINDAKIKGLLISPELFQEKGMRAAYDERIPNGLSKLSNSKGKKVTVGEHNKWPSKVFNNPDGTPKNTNTGLMFPVNNNVELQFSQPITNESESGQIGFDKKQMLKLLGPMMYNKPIAQVTVKELLQNSFDALKVAAKSTSEPLNVDIKVSIEDRTITVKDNGVGMTKDIVKKAFLTIGGTNKEGLSEGERSGGLGLAKVQFLLGAEQVNIETVRDGVKTKINATALELYDDNFQILTEQTNEPNGTSVTIKVPKDYEGSNGEKKKIEFPYDYDDRYSYFNILKKPLVGNINVTYQVDNNDVQIVPIGINSPKDSGVKVTRVYNASSNIKVGDIISREEFRKNKDDIEGSKIVSPPLYSKATFDWGSADIYISNDKIMGAYGSEASHMYLSSGLYQFDAVIRSGNDSIPYDIVIDIKPNVDTTSEQYPFNNQREGFKPTVLADIKSLEEYVKAFFKQQQRNEALDVFENIKQLPKIDPNNVLTSEEREKLFHSFNEVKEKNTEIERPREISNIYITKSRVIDSKTNEVIIDNTEKEYKSSFKAEKGIDLSAKKDTSLLNVSVPQYHNNTNIDYTQTEGAIEFFSSIGSVFLDLTRFIGKEVRGYEVLKSEDEDVFVGVSIDKNYGGLHVKGIFHALFVNPLSFEAQNKEEAIGTALHIMLHEITHTVAWEEGAGFTTALAKLYGAFYGTGKYGYYEGLVRSVYSKHFETFKELINQYDKRDTQNLSASLKGSKVEGASSGTIQSNGENVSTRRSSEGGLDGNTENNQGDKTGDVILHNIRKANNNIQNSPVAPIQEEEVIDLASLSGESVSTVRANQIKRINKLRKRKIEPKLGPEEKAALSILKGIKALAALPDESLETYANLMEDFIDTRSRSDDAAIERIPIEEFLSKVHALDSEAKHAWFKQQQEDFPELQSKDFDKDFHGEMDQVKAAIDSIQENDQSIGLGRVNNNKEMYLEKIDALRDLIIDNIDEMKDNMLRRIDDVTFNKTDSQHLKAGTWLMQDTMDDLRQYFEDYLNSILTIDVSQSSAKDVRKAYYSLMGVAYDGYMLNANNFISSEIMSLLQNEASPLQVFKSKNTAENATKLMSISAQMRSTMDTKGYEILNRIAGKFRESIKKSHMFQQNALIPYQKESIEKAQKESGFNYSDTHLQKIGIYALSRRIRISEDPKSEIERNLKQLKDSVINLSRSADATLNAASEWYNNFIDGLFSGVLNSETPLQKLEENASIIGIDDGMKGYVNDIVGFFDHFKPIARFTTEFIYGREFKEEYNYIPSMILNLNPTSGPMQYDVDDLRFDMNSSDIAERNVNVSGLSGTYDRKAQLKQNQAMVFNINHLFSNRGRLNFLDSLSAVPRREIAALFRQDSEGSKAVKSFMHDEHGSKFRYHTLENAFRTMWKNEIESTQYLHEYQGFVNGILSRWAGVVLSSAYQGVGQLISNIAPFITVNIANPGKIMDMFSAFSYASKYRFGMLTDAQANLYERLMFDLKNRHQDQVLDTSVNLGITKDSTWQAFKASAAAQGLSKVDKFVEKAKFFQFQEADFWSGAPMMMAEYLHQEKKRLGHDVKMEDLIYNEGSYFNAIDETERFIGIGNASRRGEWLTNRNVLITVLRHILTGFAGHRLNNASNAYIEMRKIATDGISVEEKTKSAAYVASIAVQSATFTAAKVFVISGIMSLVASILKDKDDDDEELKKLLDEASRANPADKKVIEAEISKRKEIRSTWENVQRRQDNSYLMTMNLTKDIASNIFIWPNLLEFAPDVLIYSTADAFEEKAFKDFKEKKMKELKTKMTNAKNLGDKVLANRFQLAIASLSSQQAVKVTMPNQGSLVPFNGMYGGAFRNIESVVKAMRDSYLGVDEFNINDFANLATVFGWSTADIQRFTRVAEDLDRANKNYQEKVNPTGKNK